MMTDRRLTRPIISLLVPIYDLLGILFPVIFTHMFILNYKTRHLFTQRGDICRFHWAQWGLLSTGALELWMIFWPLGSQNKPAGPFAKKAACANVERDACLWRSVCPTPPLGRPRGGERVQIDARDAENSAFSVRWLNATSSSLVPPSPLASTEPCDLLWQDHDLNERP